LYHRDVCALCVFGCLGTLHTMVPLRDMLLVIELTEKESSGSQKSHVLWLGRVSAQVEPLDLLSSQPHTLWLRHTNLAPSSPGKGCCGWAELFSIIGRPKIQSVPLLSADARPHHTRFQQGIRTSLLSSLTCRSARTPRLKVRSHRLALSRPWPSHHCT